MSFGRNTQLLTAVSILLVLVAVMPACTGSEEALVPSGLRGEDVEKVGFDVDDTLLFSSPSFNKGFQSDAEPFSREFWRTVNAHDAEVSCIKPKVYDIVKNYQERGAEIYAITAREPYNGARLAEFLETAYGIPADNVFFEPDGKTERITEIDLDVYFGDSNSDITDARDAGVTAVRIQRSKESNYDDKYDPGKYDEIIIESTTEHDCSFEPTEQTPATEQTSALEQFRTGPGPARASSSLTRPVRPAA